MGTWPLCQDLPVGRMPLTSMRRNLVSMTSRFETDFIFLGISKQIFLGLGRKAYHIKKDATHLHVESHDHQFCFRFTIVKLLLLCFS